MDWLIVASMNRPVDLLVFCPCDGDGPICSSRRGHRKACRTALTTSHFCYGTLQRDWTVSVSASNLPSYTL